MSAFRCLLLVGTHGRNLEAFKHSKILFNLCHHSLGFTCDGDLNDEALLAARLRELADMLEAPTVPDPELI